MSAKPPRPTAGSSKAKAYVPDRGDVVWLDLNPQAGHEQGGHRTCLILSPALYNGKTGLAVLCPITTKGKGYTFEVPLPRGLKTTGVVLADHIKNLDWVVRRAEFREKAPEALVREVIETTMTLLNPDDAEAAPKG